MNKTDVAATGYIAARSFDQQSIEGVLVDVAQPSFDKMASLHIALSIYGNYGVPGSTALSETGVTHVVDRKVWIERRPLVDLMGVVVVGHILKGIDPHVDGLRQCGSQLFGDAPILAQPDNSDAVFSADLVQCPALDNKIFQCSLIRMKGAPKTDPVQIALLEPIEFARDVGLNGYF